MLRGDIPGLSVKHFILNVYMRVVLVGLSAAIFPAISYLLIPNELIQFISTSIISLISVALSVYYIGCTQQEKYQLRLQMQKLKNKFVR